jgi:hypothetical protein
LARWPVKGVDLGERVGCTLAGDDATWLVLLRKDSRRSAEKVSFSAPGEAGARWRVLVTDLSAGRWEARRVDTSEPVAFDVTAAAGAGWFEGPAGEWVVSRATGR